MKKKIKIFDTTLRDGAQAPGCGLYKEEKIKTAVIWHKSTSKFKPDYTVDYLEDSPWIHMPFEKYETTNIKDFKFD